MPADKSRTPFSRPRGHSRNAPYTFDGPPVDIILRTADLVDFPVHRTVLEVSCSHFQHKFNTGSLGEEGDVAVKAQSMRTPPVVPMPEDSKTVDALLRYIYPVDPPVIRTVDDAFAVLRAARKYGMTHAIKGTKTIVAELADKEPLRVYAFAAARQWEEEMRVAARAALAFPIMEMYADELEGMSGGAYFRLLDYHRRCAKAATNILSEDTWFQNIIADPTFNWEPAWTSCSNPKCEAVREDGRKDTRPAWFHYYLLGIYQALAARPRPQTAADPQLFQAAIMRAAECGECRAGAPTDLKQFNTLLVQQIDRAVSKVRAQRTNFHDITHYLPTTGWFGGEIGHGCRLAGKQERV
ncbi:hypothetical protein PHLCEN_2v1699 [Hermanssonia centrifuga]|uniref:BTB domain-containing protein n=1 Tax=Hermanssonia centrifuga TaxID=98765 RepID=A0A2R6RZ99_9APHY|nr:hypothetical protein PHLCEN_2v1699 [Hermanssonia centrifuga]